jgi:hypothetical protein
MTEWQTLDARGIRCGNLGYVDYSVAFLQLWGRPQEDPTEDGLSGRLIDGLNKAPVDFQGKYRDKRGLVEEFVVEIEGARKDCGVTRWGQFTDIKVYFYH